MCVWFGSFVLGGVLLVVFVLFSFGRSDSWSGFVMGLPSSERLCTWQRVQKPH